jgi:preprotein translocase subunit SecA
MAGFLNILGKLFGNKYDKDVKEISPIVDEINIQFEKLSQLTNDQLRGKTIELKNQINDFVDNERKKVEELKEKANNKEFPAEKKKLFIRR